MGWIQVIESTINVDVLPQKFASFFQEWVPELPAEQMGGGNARALESSVTRGKSMVLFALRRQHQFLRFMRNQTPHESKFIVTFLPANRRVISF